MKFNVRKVLLAGTAIVAASAINTQANAAVVNYTLSGAAQWATAGDQTQADVTHAAAGDTVNLGANTLTVSNTGTAADTAGNFTDFHLGAITGTTGGLTLISDNNSASDSPNMVVTGTTVTISGAGAISLANDNADDQGVAATFSGAVSTGGTLGVVNAETSVAEDVTLSTGALTVGGLTTITAGGVAGADASVTANGDATLTGGATLTAATASTSAALNLLGATNTGGTITLTNATTTALNVGSNTLTAQSVANNITGAGTVNVSNSSATGVTFGGTIGAGAGVINIDNGTGALNSTATFTKAVNVTTINLGGSASGTGTNTAIFDTTGGTFTLAGALTGSTAGEIDNIVVKGGHTVTSTATVSGQIDDLSITGSGTVFSQGATTGAGIVAAHVGTGATLAVTNGTTTITGTTLTGTGAVALSGGSTIASDIDGAGDNQGVINVTAGSDAITGAVGHTHKLNAINIASGATLTATAGTGDFKATTTTLTNDGTLTIGAGVRAVTTNVVGTVTGHGIVNVANGAGTTTIAGNIGTSDIKLAQFNILGGTAQTVTTTGNIYANAVASDAGDTLQFLGDNTTQTVSGTMAGGIVTVGNGTTHTNVVFANTLTGMAATTVAAHSSALFSNTAGVTSLTNNGDIEIAAGKTVSASAGYTGGAGSSLTLQYSRSNVTENVAKLNVTGGGAVNLSNTDVIFKVISGTPIVHGSGARIADVIGGNTGAGTAAHSVTDNSYLYNFSLVSVGNDFDLQIDQAHDLDDVDNNNGNTEAGEVLLADLATSTNAEINAIQANLVNASDEHEVKEILDSVQPDVGGGATVGAMTMTDLSLGVSNDRLAMLRSGDNSTGMATGNVSQGLRMWGQVYGAHANQDERDGVNGFDADTFGGAVGLDTENAMNDHSVVGVALSYGNTSVDNEGLGSNEADVDSYQLTLYGDMDLGNAMYLNGQLAYAWGNTETDRHDIGGVSGLDAHGEYDSNTYAARAELGKDYQYDKATITPHVMGNWVHFDPDSYDETGAGGANLHVAGDSLDIIEAGIGADVSWMYQNGDGSYLEPKLSAGYRYNFGDDQVETTSSFAAGGDAFRTQGADPASSRFNVGASIRYFSTDNWDLTAGYNYDFREDYGAHSGMVRAAYKF